MTSPLVEAWSSFLGRWPWDWFCTLTFRDLVHPESADKRFRLFVSQMNRRLYGARWWKHAQGVRWVRASEPQRREVLHYHALLGGGGLASLRRLSWMDAWNEIAGFARIEPPLSGNAVRGYCAKYVVKGGEIDIGGPLERPPPLLFSPGWAEVAACPEDTRSGVVPCRASQSVALDVRRS